MFVCVLWFSMFFVFFCIFCVFFFFFEFWVFPVLSCFCVCPWFFLICYILCIFLLFRSFFFVFSCMFFMLLCCAFCAYFLWLFLFWYVLFLSMIDLKYLKLVQIIGNLLFNTTTNITIFTRPTKGDCRFSTFLLVGIIMGRLTIIFNKVGHQNLIFFTRSLTKA